MPTIRIPTPLRPYAEGAATVEVGGETIAEALDQLTTAHPKLRRHLYDEYSGALRSFVNIYKGDEDIRYLEGEATRLVETDTLSIIPAIAGGVGPAADAVVELSRDEIARYSRHLVIPEVGMSGQRKLKASRVLCVGAGGLGSPLALYLAAAGVGTLGIVDFDAVDASNLQRQILHGESDIGRSKLESAAARIREVNPFVRVECHETRLSAENALNLFQDYDVVVDGTDNFPTRYLVNDACVLLGKPNAYASIFRFEGQASVFLAERGPCYRCLYPEPPPPGLVPSCAEGGVLGVLPGLLGVIQATETINLLLGVGEPLIGRLLLVDALGMEFREVRVRKDPACRICGDTPELTALREEEWACELPETASGAIPTITVERLAERLRAGDELVVLDVREPHEVEICALPGSLRIPLGQLSENLHRLNSADEIVVHCKLGGRSAKAVGLLEQAGFRKVYNLEGGIDRWAERVEVGMPRY